MVVIRPCSMPKASSSTLTSGARQFVVQEALEMILSSGLSVSWLTPITIMASISSLAGTVRITLPAPASMCFWQASREAKMPVASMQKSIWFCLCGSLAGSLSALIAMRFPLTVIESLSEASVPSNLPCTESHLSRCASVLGSVRSLICTTSMSGCASRLRKTRRPMRPKPLIAMRMGRAGRAGEDWVRKTRGGDRCRCAVLSRALCALDGALRAAQDRARPRSGGPRGARTGCALRAADRGGAQGAHRHDPDRPPRRRRARDAALALGPRQRAGRAPGSARAARAPRGPGARGARRPSAAAPAARGAARAARRARLLLARGLFERLAALRAQPPAGRVPAAPGGAGRALGARFAARLRARGRGVRGALRELHLRAPLARAGPRRGARERRRYAAARGLARTRLAARAARARAAPGRAHRRAARPRDARPGAGRDQRGAAPRLHAAR